MMWLVSTYLFVNLWILLVRDAFALTDPSTIGVYIHIPFCRRRCFYCDFPIQVVGERKSTQQSEALKYIHTLLQDIDTTFKYLNPDGTIKTISTIYFGGGTPSLLEPKNIETILRGLKRHLPLSPDCEITMETDPGTFDFDYLQRLEAIGVNRVSMGLQSFNDETLLSCGRPHTVEETYRAIEYVHQSAIFQSNFNIDIISSLPHMTIDSWQDTLIKAINVRSSHISVYDLQIEEKTAFGRWYTPGSFPLPSETSAASMYTLAVQELTSHRGGFEHYEISNYAKPGKASRHNQKYWACEDVVALGMGAASLVRGQRYSRPSTRQQYDDWVDKRRELSTTMTTSATTTTRSNFASTNNNNNSNNNSSSSSSNNSGGSSSSSGSSNNNSNNTNNDIITIDINNINNSNILSLDLEVTTVDLLERVMLALRTARGLRIMEIKREYGDEVVRKIIKSLRPYETTGHVKFIKYRCSKQLVGLNLNSSGSGNNNNNCNSSSCSSDNVSNNDNSDNNNSIYSNNNNNNCNVKNSNNSSSDNVSNNDNSDNKSIYSNNNNDNDDEYEYEYEYVCMSDSIGFVISNTIISSVFTALT